MSKPKALLIAEKPSLMRTIKSVYEKHKEEVDYEIDFLSQAGHLLTLKTPDELGLQGEDKKTKLPIFPDEESGWQYKLIPGVEKLYNDIKGAIQSGKYEYIIHAGDPDREGQLLIDIVLDAVDCDKYISKRLRFWSNDTTETTVFNALKNMEDGKNVHLINLGKAGVVRQHFDWLFGMNGSSAARLKSRKREAVGRVKTVVVKMIVDREEEIKNFKPRTKYKVEVLYVNELRCTMFNPKVKDEGEEEYKKEDIGIVYFETEQEAKAFIENIKNIDNGVVKSVISKESKTYAPELYKMSSLQVDASNKYNIRPDDTLSIVQSLYTSGYMTYPRTDCALISSNTDFYKLINVVGKIEDYSLFATSVSDEDIARIKKTKTYVNDEEMAKHGHTGLCPTEKSPDLDKLSENELKIYKLVCNRFLAIFLKPLVQSKTEIITQVNKDDSTYLFKCKGKTLLSKGYTELTGVMTTDVLLPVVKEGDLIQIREYGISSKTTSCPLRFTNALLISAMETPGKFFTDESIKNTHKSIKLGTEATRSEIIKTLIEKDNYLQYVKSGKSEYIIPTENGVYLINMLGELDICKVDMSAHWEDVLDQIKDGELSVSEAEIQVKRAVTKLVEDISKRDIEPAQGNSKSKNYVCDCPCGGDIIAAEKNYFCSNYKSGCKNSMFKNFLGATITNSDMKKLIQDKGTIIKKLKKDASTWEQILKYSFEDHKLEFCKK